jgi:hypothetical protein
MHWTQKAIQDEINGLVEKTLNELEVQGWELVGVVPDAQLLAAKTVGVVCFFKRPMNES